MIHFHMHISIILFPFHFVSLYTIIYIFTKCVNTLQYHYSCYYTQSYVLFNSMPYNPFLHHYKAYTQIIISISYHHLSINIFILYNHANTHSIQSFHYFAFTLNISIQPGTHVLHFYISIYSYASYCTHTYTYHMSTHV